MRTAALAVAALLVVGLAAVPADASHPQCDPDHQYCDPPPLGHTDCTNPPAGGWKQVAMWVLGCV